MRTVGAFEAKTKLSELLDLVEAGEEIAITRHESPWPRWSGRESLRRKKEALERLLKSMDEIRSPAKGFGGIKELIEEGRRY
jgi:antitoxin (DNA-binding transcriptional repressor) of toxin-antitoxin stability system